VVDIDQRNMLFESSLSGYAGIERLGTISSQTVLIALSGQCILINMGLAIFNMLPLGPLDGSSVLRAFIPDSWLPLYDRLQPFMQIVLLILVFTGLFRIILYPIFMFLIGILGLLQTVFLG
jgi:Zn-dependent protease